MIRPALPVMQQQVIETGESDLLFIWGESRVPLMYQFDLINLGYSTLRGFASLDDSRAAVRVALAAELALDVAAAPPAGPNARLALSSLVAAWEISREQFNRELQLRAESKVLKIVRPVSTTDRAGMRRAVETLFGKIPNREAPSTDYISQKLEEIEQGEMIASPLDEVTSQTDIESPNVTANIDISGKVQILRKRAKSTLPGNPEELRLRLRVERNVWLYLATKFNNRPFLIGLAPSHWDIWTDYFLGHRVMLLEIPTPDGTRVPLHPPWQIVLSYEFECRKRVMELILEEGLTMIAALERVPRDGELKEIAFTSPLALMNRGTKRAPDPGFTDAPKPVAKKAKGKGKGGPGKGRNAKGGGPAAGKGKGKGKLLSKTPDGRRICYNFNSPAGCNKADCDFAHICQRKSCLGPHSFLECPDM